MAFDGPHGWQWLPLAAVYTYGVIVTFLSGYKTYIGAGCFLVWGLVQIFVLKDMSGGMQSIVAAWTALGLRAAIAKVPAAEAQAFRSAGIQR